MWLVFFALAAGCSVQLRGLVGGSDAPLPDDSTVAGGGHPLRRLAGVAVSSLGVGLFLIGITSPGTPGDGVALTLSWFFKASGVIVFLVGLPFALMRPRNDE